MQVRVLGCSGGIGGSLRTTSFMLDHDILIDAGTGVGDLSLTELSMIDHVFVTHAHLDHIACIPLLVDSVGAMRDKPLTIHATAATLAILKQHIFNWQIWPDFSAIPDREQPFMQFAEIELGKTFTSNGRKITPVPAHHVVPAVGFWIEGAQHSLVFSGDTSSCAELWPVVNTINNLKYLVIETAFSNAEIDLAILSKHFCPSLLAKDLRHFKGNAEIFITHLKPGEVELTMQEITECVVGFIPKMLQNGATFEL